MKHIFIINPAAGKSDKTAEYTAKIESACKGLNYEIRLTEAPGDAIIYYDQYGNVISEEQALTDHLYEGDRIVASYVRRNEAVQNIRYSIQNGEVQFLEVLTWDEYYRGRAQLNVFNTLFGFTYAAEYLIAFWFYLVKRKKA